MIQGSRSVDESTKITRFSWVVPPVRYVQSPDPIQYVQLDNKQPDMLIKGIQALGITADPVVTFELFGAESLDEPQWNLASNGAPVLAANSPTDISITATMKCTV
mmetsp:Transcript_27976/g.5106  ORF Transcript_27976/g.5106 Transcript_27976/m.5106 type:complete len:105 (+) Transcript_27976:5928-6242(+)